MKRTPKRMAYASDETEAVIAPMDRILSHVRKLDQQVTELLAKNQDLESELAELKSFNLDYQVQARVDADTINALRQEINALREGNRKVVAILHGNEQEQYEEDTSAPENMDDWYVTDTGEYKTIKKEPTDQDEQ